MIYNTCVQYTLHVESIFGSGDLGGNPMVSAGLGRWVVIVCGIDELPRFGTGCKNIELSKFKGGIPDSILYHISSCILYHTKLCIYIYIY